MNQAPPPTMQRKADHGTVKIEISRRLVVINSLSSVCSRIVTVVVWFWVNKVLMEDTDHKE